MPRFSAHLGFLFTDRPLLERFTLAKAHGFVAVEHPTPYEIPAGTMAGVLRETGLAFAQVAVMGDPARGEKGLACLPGRKADFRAAFGFALDYAEAIGARMVHAASGLTPAGTSPDAVWNVYLENLRIAGRACRERGVRLVMEAISSQTVAGFFMDDPRKAIRAIGQLGDCEALLLFDAYHARLCGLDPLSFFTAERARIGHIHVADEPGRHEPGTGTIDFSAFFRAVDESGYEGLVGCEYVPQAGTVEGLGWLAEASPRRSSALETSGR